MFFVFLSLIGVLGFFGTLALTNKEIISKTIDSGVNYKKSFIKKSLLFSLVPISSMIVLYYKNFPIEHSALIVMLVTLYVLMYIEASITDPAIKRVNRFLLRYVYIINLITIVYLSKQYEVIDKEMLYQDIFSVSVVLVVLMFIVMGVGASDFRCIYISITTYLFCFGKLAAVPFLGNMILAMIYQKYKQAKTKEKTVANGDKILFPIPYIFIFSLLFEFSLRI